MLNLELNKQKNYFFKVIYKRKVFPKVYKRDIHSIKYES